MPNREQYLENLADLLTDEVYKLRTLVCRAQPLVGHAEDVPQKELEAQQWAEDAQRALDEFQMPRTIAAALHR